MTYREAYKIAQDWKYKASLISTFHYKHQLLNRKWTMRDTAKYFSISVGKVCEDIKIVLSFEKIENCKTRQDALIILK